MMLFRKLTDKDHASLLVTMLTNGAILWKNGMMILLPSVEEQCSVWHMDVMANNTRQRWQIWLSNFKSESGHSLLAVCCFYFSLNSSPI